MKRGREMLGSLKNKLTVALIQMQSQCSPQDNFDQAITFLSEAIDEHHATLIVYPENFLCLGVSDYSKFYDDFVFFIQEFKRLAKHYKVSILLGSIPFPVNDGSQKCFSRSILISDKGEMISAYDKIHLFDALVNDSQGQYKESNSFEAGYETQVVSVSKYNLGLSICYDLRFPELYQALRLRGADVLAVPSAFTYNTGEAHWEILLRARAIETQCFVLGANQCGEHCLEKDNTVRKTWGHSMIVDPWGKVLSSLEHLPGVCSAELDFQELVRIRKSMDMMSYKNL